MNGATAAPASLTPRRHKRTAVCTVTPCALQPANPSASDVRAAVGKLVKKAQHLPPVPPMPVPGELASRLAKRHGGASVDGVQSLQQSRARRVCGTVPPSLITAATLVPRHPCLLSVHAASCARGAAPQPAPGPQVLPAKPLGGAPPPEEPWRQARA